MMASDFPQLPDALPGKRHAINTPSGWVSFYCSDPAPAESSANTTPLLLIHIINAAGSSYEVHPIYEEFRADRPVYSIDLPGFGFSERSDRTYSTRVMIDAIHAMVSEILQRHDDRPIDALA